MIVRNIGGRADRLTLRFRVPPQLIRERVRIRVTHDEFLIRAPAKATSGVSSGTAKAVS
jgi:hypothetical protein